MVLPINHLKGSVTMSKAIIFLSTKQSLRVNCISSYRDNNRGEIIRGEWAKFEFGKFMCQDDELELLKGLQRSTDFGNEFFPDNPKQWNVLAKKHDWKVAEEKNKRRSAWTNVSVAADNSALRNENEELKKKLDALQKGAHANSSRGVKREEESNKAKV